MKRSTRPVVVTPLEWRNQMKAGKTCGIARGSTIERAEDGSVSFIASSIDADRYGDTIDQSGWDTASFEKNPVLLWAHSHSTPPVGKVGKLVKDGGPLRATECEFTPAEMNAFGDQVGQMVKAGFLNSVSVGFLPKAWEERYDEGGRFLGYHFKEMELLEISVVPVPANPQALVEGKSFAKALADWTKEPDESAPMARGFQSELQGWFKAVDDVAERAADEADASGFARMVELLERIAAASEAQARDLAELRKSMTPAPKVKAFEPGPGAGELDLAEFLGVDAVVETPAVSEDGDASTLASALFGEG